MEHIALVAVIHGQGAKGPLHHHLAQAHGAGLEGDVGDPVDRHAGGDLQPEASVTRNRQEPLGNGAHIGR